MSNTKPIKKFISSIYKPDCVETIEEIKNEKDGCFQYNPIPYDGIYIKTNLQEMHFLIDSEKCCSEDFGVELHGCEEQDLIGDVIKTVRWSIDKKEFVSENDPNPDNSYYVSDYRGVVIYIETNNRKVFIELYNIHNGYYSHSIKVKWGKYEDYDDL